MRNGIVTKIMAAVSAAATLVVGGVLVGASTAMAADDAKPSITVNAPEQSKSEQGLLPPSLEGDTFYAYKLANYSDVTVKDGKITGYNPTTVSDSNGKPYYSDAILKKWITYAAVVNKTSQLPNVLDNDGNFIGEAQNLTPMQFIAKYFYGAGTDRYGAGTDRYGNDHASSEELKRFADAAHSNGYFGIDAVGLDTGITADVVTKDKAVFNNLPQGDGIYIVTEYTPKVADDQMASRAMIVGTTYTDPNGTVYSEFQNSDGTTTTLGQIYLKAEKVAITKTVDQKPLAIGSTRKFTVTTNMPDYDQYEFWENTLQTSVRPAAYFYDNPSDNLDPFTRSGDWHTGVKNLKITATPKNGGAATELKEGTDYVFVLAGDTSNDSNDFRIAFGPDKNTPAASKFSNCIITMTYDATVTSLLPDKTENTVDFNFNNTPTLGGYGTVFNNGSRAALGKVSASVNLYTTELSLQKVKYNDKNTQLEGAQFAVTDASGNAVKFKKETDTKGNSIYSLDKSGSADSSNIVEVGNMKIDGLAADTDAATVYTFTEKKAPEGYILGENPVTFNVTVTPSVPDGKMKSVSYNVASAGTADFSNFLDLTDSEMFDKNTQTVAVADDASSVTTTKLAGGTVRVENTTNVNDFAKTGGQIQLVIWAVAALALVGTAFMVLARMRRRA